MARPTLKASEIGKKRINQAKCEKSWTIEDEEPLLLASEWLEPQIDWRTTDYGTYAKNVSQPTWKRFLAGNRITSKTFQAFCYILELNWEEVVEGITLDMDSKAKFDLTCAPDLAPIYGRSQELIELKQLVLKKKSRLVVVHGQAGIGKSCLIRQLVEEVTHQFEFVIWRSQDNEYLVPELLSELTTWIQAQYKNIPTMAQFLELLNQHKCLIILDDWETLLDIGKRAGKYKSGYQDYEKLLERISETAQQSCVLLLSRELPQHLEQVERRSISKFKLEGLKEQGAQDLMLAEGLKGKKEQRINFSRKYSNPWVLKQIAILIREWGGDLQQFNETVMLNNPVADFLGEQLYRLPDLEKKVLYAIALRRYPVFREQLQQDTATFAMIEQLISATRTLKDGRSLIEKDELGFYSVDPVMLKYLTTHFVEQSVKEILNAIDTQKIYHSELFITHAFLSPTDLDEPLRAEQIRRIVKPIQAELMKQFSPPDQLKTQLNQLITHLEQSHLPKGYALANLQHLLQVSGL